MVVSAVELTNAQVREHLVAAGFTNLWIPREVVRVEKIPTLASGKLDLKALRELAAGGE